ncbi:hypothetical protein J4573_45080 [Actinomadura barringtoniae]|uniref:LuxR family transcriptional regulator n=1 Tax=Actinomadura barringtoniae TaxID=1427535 RepID=A0A939TC95_9ACTN|nr:hypothetical protein [Actinomadura barringtoniae]
MRTVNDVEGSLRKGERLLIAGNPWAARGWFDVAYRRARERSDATAMARAALGLGGLWVHEHRTVADAAVVRERQSDALRRVHQGSALALRLRIRMTAEDEYGAGAHEMTLAMVEEARLAGDAVALAEALSLAHHCLMGPEHALTRLELAQELIGTASRTSRRGDLLMGLLLYTVDLFLTAHPHAERRLAELRELLTREDHLAVASVVDALAVMLCVRSGSFARAEEMATALADRAGAIGDVNATGWFGGQLGTIRWFEGRIAELVPLLEGLVNSPMLSVGNYAYYPGLAVAAASAGDRRMAAAMLARLRGRDMADVPRSASWMMTMYSAVEASALLEDRDTAAQAYALLAPYSHLPVVASLGVSCLGSAHHSLGVASLTTGDVDRAVKHLRAAVHSNLAVGHLPAVALARARLGQALHMRQDIGASQEASLAAQEAALLGMALPDLGQGSAVAPGAPYEVVHSNGLGVPAGERLVCRRRGRRWAFELAGRLALADHTVGMGYLAVLIANPGREILATDLAAGPGPESPSDPAASTQPVLDEVAKREFKRRLTRLEAEIDELEALNELERAAKARTERDWLITELAAAAGLGGRTRDFPGADERARIAVGKAIRRALKRIADADPIIGAHLRAAVHTGLRCSYRPE